MDENEKKVRHTIFLAFFLFFCMLTMMFGIFLWVVIQNQGKDLNAKQKMQIVQLNEIEEKTKINKVSPAKKEIHILQEQLRNQKEQSDGRETKVVIVSYFCIFTFLIFIFSYVYLKILRPFETLETFAKKIAKGDFEEVLRYERTNMFGEFTWAFDHMRREIVKARANEKEAVENNKTVIATLSHDIKTPIASIRSYAEALEANMDSTYERKQKYLGVIITKCEEVTRLTNDLFLHAISDLDRLEIEKMPLNVSALLDETIKEQTVVGMDITKNDCLEEIWVMGDERRLKQVFMNILKNSDKYAPGKRVIITLSLDKTKEILMLHFRDMGQGVSPKDIPFLCDKFYRGEQKNTVEGAGLGLYIVKYIMEQLSGEVELKNDSNGFEVILKMPYISKV